MYKNLNYGALLCLSRVSPLFCRKSRILQKEMIVCEFQGCENNDHSMEYIHIYIYAARNNFIWSTVWRVARGYYVKHNENKKIYCMGTYSASAASILPPKTNRAFMELNRIITYWHGGTELKLGKDSGLSWFLATALFIFLGFQSIQSFVGLSLFPCGIPGAF